MAIRIINPIYSLPKYGRYHKSSDQKKEVKKDLNSQPFLQEMTLAIIIIICAKLVK
jgi:hypothetical protein